jgi:hypothetical protein
MHENCQPADHPVGNRRRLQSRSEPLGDIEDFFHCIFENGVGQHGFLSLF